MSYVWRIASFAAVALLAPAQPPSQDKGKQQRDLKYEENNIAATPAVTVPRGYALIIGIGNYKNLPARAQLEYSERDAD